MISVFLYLYLDRDSKVGVKEVKKNISENEIVKNEESKEENLDVKNLDLLGRSETSFYGSTEGRGKNIDLGIKKINGMVLQPGEEFSFIKTVGESKEEDGYTEQKVFLNDEVTTGIGGGLCQVSTTLFRSALSAGLKITERKNHTYTVPLYDIGLDAVYAYPYTDLKFINDTKNPIVIKGKVENQKAIFEIYGKYDGRVASTTEPEISDTTNILPVKYKFVLERSPDEPRCLNGIQIGYTAKVKYGIAYSDGKYVEQIFQSKYKPLQKVCYIVGLKELSEFNTNLKNKRY